MKLSERFKFDDRINLAHIDGHPVAGEVFDTFTKVTPPGQWFRITEAEPGGAIVIETKREDAKPPVTVTHIVCSGVATREEIRAAIAASTAQLKADIARSRNHGGV